MRGEMDLSERRSVPSKSRARKRILEVGNEFKGGTGEWGAEDAPTPLGAGAR